MAARILIIDDDLAQRRLLKNAIESSGYHAIVVESSNAALAYFKQQHEQIDAAIIDLAEYGHGNERLLESLVNLGTNTPIIVLTGQGTVTKVIKAVGLGAFDFLLKPLTVERISAALDNALNSRVGSYKTSKQKRGNQPALLLSDILAASPAMMRVKDLAQRAAHSSIPVILEGEAGVGKTMIAQAIHAASERSNRKFVRIDCSSVADRRLEELLISSNNGTEAKSTSKALELNYGTLYLADVGDLTLDAQAQLLSLIHQVGVDRLESPSSVKFDFRIIASTSRDLIELVKDGLFREDLYYLINVFPITMPALRKRKEEIPNLVRAFVEHYSKEQKLVRPLSIPPYVLAALTEFDWPGNIRQLENSVFRAVTMATADALSLSDFPEVAAKFPHLINSEGAYSLHVLDDSAPHNVTVEAPNELISSDFAGANMSRDGDQSVRAVISSNHIASIDDHGNVRKIAEIEEELIRFALGFYRGQMSQVARKLGIGRSTLYRKLKDYGIDPDDPLRDVA